MTEPKIFRDRFLSERMRLRADMDGLPRGHELRTLADAIDGMDLAVIEYQPTMTNVVQVQNAMRVWEAARKLWSEYSGERPQEDGR